ncbi:phage tail protein [Maricaulis sp. D1M11]|uniref:phage tail protein n=1 Tax=Maricaulis sp. D1M11 TaxID=3076117 RepID=UPI0039B5B747
MTHIFKQSLAAVTCSLALTGLSVSTAHADTDPYLGDIIMVGFDWCPRGFAKADGSLINTSDNPALFALLGTRYGGNGSTNFALPDMRGRVPVHPNPGNAPAGVQIVDGGYVGAETVTLTTANLPAHNHVVGASSNAPSVASPNGALVGTYPSGSPGAYGFAGAQVAMSSDMLAPTGNGAAFSTIAPSAVVQFCVAISGVFPSRN